MFVLWMVLAVVFFVLFIALGTWQVHRYHVRKHISHAMRTRVHADPVAAPGPAQWSKIDAGHLQYLHVSLAGHYLPIKQTLVRGSSSDGYGYWVMAPLQTERGFIVLVNRGYIPASLPGTPAFKHAQPPTGKVDLSGLLRSSEPGGGFMRANKPDKGLWYSRDVKAIAASDHLAADHVAPYFVDADAVANSPHWPVAGLTRVTIYNESMGYAITWYALALGTLLAAGIVIRYERARQPAAD
ncbi:MAG TPA: SURF1 family protein [Rhodanobacteraceae bacterium]